METKMSALHMTVDFLTVMWSVLIWWLVGEEDWFLELINEKRTENICKKERGVKRKVSVMTSLLEWRKICSWGKVGNWGDVALEIDWTGTAVDKGRQESILL